MLFSESNNMKIYNKFSSLRKYIPCSEMSYRELYGYDENTTRVVQVWCLSGQVYWYHFCLQ